MIDRRSLLSGLSATLLTPGLARATTVIDASGRAIVVPDKVEHIFAAGPPASVLLYTLAPDLLLGWTRSHEPAQCEFLGAGACDKPEVGRLTGRGNTTNVEVLLKFKPDLILDVGTVNDTYISLANRVQEQTGIPYALLDGRFDAMVPVYRKLGELTRRQDQAEAFARYAENTIATIKGRIDKIPATNDRGFIMGEGRMDSKPDSAARSTLRQSSSWARITSPPSAGAAWRPSLSNKFWPGIRTSSSPSNRRSPLR